MKIQSNPSTGLRARKKLELRARLKQCAMELFARQGYTRTTLEEIAEKADVSARTLFRYFSTKEDLLFDDDYDAHLVESFLAQPPELSVIAVLRSALADAFGQMTDEQRTYERLRHTVITQTPELQVRNNHELVRNIELLTALIAKRTNKEVTDPQVRTLAGALVGVLIAAQTGSDSGSLLQQADNSLKQLENLLAKGDDLWWK